VRHNPTILADQLGSIARLPRAAQAAQRHCSPRRSQMKNRLTRLFYSLADLAALAAALGAGNKWR
jgi:hypothetical protein